MDILKMALFLFVVCAVAATALALTNELTEERILENKRKAEAEAREAVVGGVKAADCRERELTLDGGTVKVYDYFDAANRRVAIVLKGTAKGFGGKMEFMLGADPQGRILGIKALLPHQETPGLGTRVLSDEWLAQLKGLRAPEAALSRDDPKGKVDAITGVTITSRGISAGVVDLLRKLEEKDEFGK
jgi:electron transport complex protein RnfG